jgi:acyl-CoA thioesterase FadM
MTLYIRLLFILLLAKFRRHSEPLEPVITNFRVWPSDLDLFGHLTNSRYFALMDLGRTDFIARSGILGDLRCRGWYPVVVEESMQFRRSLNPFQSFKLKTQITGYDERHILMRQTFLLDDQVAALGVVRARFLGKNGQRVSPQQVLELASVSEAPTTVSFSQQEQNSYSYHRELIEQESALIR